MEAGKSINISLLLYISISVIGYASGYIHAGSDANSWHLNAHIAKPNVKVLRKGLQKIGVGVGAAGALAAGGGSGIGFAAAAGGGFGANFGGGTGADSFNDHGVSYDGGDFRSSHGQGGSVASSWEAGASVPGAYGETEGHSGVNSKGSGGLSGNFSGEDSLSANGEAAKISPSLNASQPLKYGYDGSEVSDLNLDSENELISNSKFSAHSSVRAGDKNSDKIGKLSLLNDGHFEGGLFGSGGSRYPAGYKDFNYDKEQFRKDFCHNPHKISFVSYHDIKNSDPSKEIPCFCNKGLHSE